MRIPIFKLEDACSKITDGTHHSPPIVEDGIPYVTAKHVKPEGLKFFENPWFISEKDHREIFSRCDPQRGDVLYIKDGATTGIAALNEYDFPFSMLSSVALLRPKANLCDSRFLCLWLNSPLSKEKFIGQMGGAAIKRLTLSKIKQFQIPLPPLAEQKRIAAILDAADALRNKRREALAQLDALLQSTFLTLFGDPVANPMGWPTSSFEDCIQDKTSSAIKIPKSDFQAEGQWQIIDQSQNEIAGYSNDGPPFKESLPAVVFGDHTRCVKLVREPFLLGADGAKLLIPRKQMLAVFLNHLLPLLKIPDLGYSRHMREVKRLAYILPPLPLQQKFAAIVESVERQKAAQRAHLAELDALFAALQHRAFRGEL